MKVAPGVGNVEIREIPDPKAGPGQVVIEVAACGICGTDYHIYHDAYKSSPPVVLGHEIAGTIVETGPTFWCAANTLFAVQFVPFVPPSVGPQ